MKYLILFLIVLSGCASNPYKKFYNDQTEGKELLSLPVIIPTEKPRMIQGTDPKESYKEMTREGYLMLGYSEFHGAISDEEDALSFAEKIQAEVVVVFSKYTGTKSGSVPIMMPTTQTSYSTGNATLYGSNGNTYNAYGSGTTTTYGSQTNYMPFSVDQYDQGAQFWIKGKPRTFGANAQDLSEERRKEISSNKGVELALVIKGSPAFKADFFEGDVIKKIDGKEIGTIQEYSETLASLKGKNIEIEFIRAGKQLKKLVQLN